MTCIRAVLSGRFISLRYNICPLVEGEPRAISYDHAQRAQACAAGPQPEASRGIEIRVRGAGTGRRDAARNGRRSPAQRYRKQTII